ncbi:globin [Paenibacillus thermoaerophilus]|jgi:hemoglobin|uniref:Globin n=1 Tax=Paenibacillus thermoaerophilus TaxID=1215385 RepID=A0ABW2V5X5_9BACL|nr:globin [Paenibacillus thermoaerophilus]TMV18513.1 globin [Paenibacillus thermoaerophilus]
MERETVTFYELLGGTSGIRRIVEAFYPKVLQEPLLAPLFPKDITPVMEKQTEFLTQFFGGPPLFSEKYGHPMMRARHMRFPVTRERADAWLGCMRRALDEVGVEPALRDAVMERLQGPAYHFVNS